MFDRLSQWLLREPRDREQLKALLHSAHERKLMDDEAVRMIDGVLKVSEMQVRDIMLPRAQMITVSADMSPAEAIPKVADAGHSRYPVTSADNSEQILGILLAKDLLQFIRPSTSTDPLTVRNLMRPVTCIPESKRLNVLLQEFRSNQNHMAIVVDEYGVTCGLITIEDVLEQIVGDIEDEYDINEGEPDIKQISADEYRIKALTPIEDFNEYFGCDYQSEDYDTIGGLVLQRFSHFPKRGESIRLNKWHITVLHASSRGISLLSLKELHD